MSWLDWSTVTSPGSAGWVLPKLEVTSGCWVAAGPGFSREVSSGATKSAAGEPDGRRRGSLVLGQVARLEAAPG